jgi:hypothetical protein
MWVSHPKYLNKICCSMKLICWFCVCVHIHTHSCVSSRTNELTRAQGTIQSSAQFLKVFVADTRTKCSTDATISLNSVLWTWYFTAPCIKLWWTRTRCLWNGSVRYCARASQNWMCTTSIRRYVSLLCSFVKYCIFKLIVSECDRLCSLVVRVLGYRSGGPGSIPGTTRKKNK